MKIFGRRNYGLHPDVARASVAMPPAMERFTDLVSRTSFGILIAWSVLFYLAVVFPHARALQLATTISFLLIPLLIMQSRVFYDNVEAERWPKECLGDRSWVLREWAKSFAALMAELLVFFSIVYLILRLLIRFFEWPASLFAWLVARTGAVFGISTAQPPGWLAGYFFFLGASLCFVNFLYLWSGILNLAEIGAMADTQFVYEKVLSPAIYGGLARFLSASFIPILLLSAGGAALKAWSGIATVMSWGKPRPLELDLLAEADRFLPWLSTLQLLLALTIARVLLFRVRYAQSIMRALWSSRYSEFGSVLLALPLFFNVALTTLPLGRFYDGFAPVAQWVFAVVYLALLIPMFLLMLKEVAE